MQFTATLIRNTPVWWRWRNHQRTGGEINGVPFRWVLGDNFATGVLNEAQVRELRGRVDIEFAAVAAAPEAVLAALDAGDVTPPAPVPPAVRPVLALPKSGGGRHQYPSQHRQGR